MRYIVNMSVEEIERAIEKLPAKDRAKLLAKIANEEWDRQIEADLKAGKFDALAEKAIAEHKAGLSRKL
jgi:hypothetical protein